MPTHPLFYMPVLRANILCYLLVWSVCPGLAQVDSFMQIPPARRPKAVFHYLNALPLEDSARIMSTAKRLEEDFRHRQAWAEMRQAWWFGYYYRAHRLHKYDALGPAIIDEAIRMSERRDWTDIQGAATVLKGQLLLETGGIEQGFENMYRGFHILEDHGLLGEYHVCDNLLLIGNAHYLYRDFEEAYGMFHRVLSTRGYIETDPGCYWWLNTAALTYQKLMKHDSASILFTLARENARKNGLDFWVTLITGNMGQNYYLMGHYARALPLLEEDFLASDSTGEKGSAVQAALAVSTIRIAQGEYAQASRNLDYVQRNMPATDYRVLRQYYTNRYALAREAGELNAALTYGDSARIYTDSVNASDSRSITAHARQRVTIERYGRQLQSLREARDRQVLLRNGLVLLFLLSGVIIYLYVNRMLLKQRKEKELAHLQTRMAEDELDAAKRELGRITRAMREKNDLIDSFRAEIAALQDAGVPISDERTLQLDQLLHATILTEEDWQVFRSVFDKVHPGFSTRLREKIPDLTPADTRLLTLTKLGLSSREMAAMLGISTEAIKKTRYRLRKKIDLPEEGGLEDLVQMI